MKIKEALQVISDKLAKLPNPVELPLLVDTEEFRIENPDLYPTGDSWYEMMVSSPPVASRMTAAAALRFILGNVPLRNATYVVMPDHVLVTTHSATSPERKLQQKVRGSFEKQPLHVVLRELSEMAGATIIVDNRATEKAKAVVSATFLNEIDLAGALRVLAEMAELKAIVLDGAIFVTTGEHVATLRKEHAERAKSIADKVKAVPPPKNLVGGTPGGLHLPPGFHIAPDPDPGFDPFWPYFPQRPFGVSGGGPVRMPLSLINFRPAEVCLH